MSMPPAGLWPRPKAILMNMRNTRMAVLMSTATTAILMFTENTTTMVTSMVTNMLIYTKSMITMVTDMVMIIVTIMVTIIHMSMRHTRTAIFTAV